MREISTTYGRLAGGYIWAFAEPILGIALLTVIFQYALGAAHPLLGTSFPLFYASGYIPFQTYSDIGNKVARSLRFSRPLLAYPSVTFIDALLARIILNSMVYIIVFGGVIIGIVLIEDIPGVMNVATMLRALALAIFLASGIGTLNCFLIMRFPIWEQVWSILNRPLFLISGVFFTYDLMPVSIRDILWWNPLLHIIGLMRHGIYGIYRADYVSEIYVVSVSAITLAAGLFLLGRRYKDLLELF